MSGTFENKVVVVTGASKGIGAEIAKRFGHAGAHVVVNYASSKSGADAVVGAITSEGGKAVALQGDVSIEEDVKQLFSQVKAKFGRVDVLVNNAGVFAFTSLEGVTADEFHRQYNVNVLGLLLASREALPLFGEDGGSIVNISSVVSTLAPPNSAIYSGTKGAVDSITRSLAKELGARKIRVNAVSPGPVLTEGSSKLGAGDPESDFVKQMTALSPLGRIGTPDDIAGTVLHVASEAASWITGELWAVGGGIR